MANSRDVWVPRRVARRFVWLLVTALTQAPALAHAHFVLLKPDSWMSQTAYGHPEKLGPCGDEGGGTPTGAITTVHPGQTIEIQINEAVHHPGHYRVALAVNSRDELPPEPAITPAVGDPCDRAEIQDPPIFPVLRDNALPHTEVFNAPQAFPSHCRRT